MKAIRYYGPKDLRLEDIPEPVVGPGQVKIKVSVQPSFERGAQFLNLKPIILDCLVRDTIPGVL